MNKIQRLQSEVVETANGGEVANEGESDEVANEGEKSDYMRLWDDFKKKWHFTTLCSIGSYVLYGSGDDLTLSKYIRDKRYSSGYRMVSVFTTDNPNEMREYLTTNNPIVTL